MQKVQAKVREFVYLVPNFQDHHRLTVFPFHSFLVILLMVCGLHTDIKYFRIQV